MTTATCTASVYMVRMCINALQNRCGGQCDWMGMVLCKGFPKWKKAIGFTVVNCFNGYLTLRVLKGLKPVSLLVGGGSEGFGGQRGL